jgi:hypothetical protein
LPIGRIRRTTQFLGAFLVVLGLLPAAAAASNTLGTYGTLSSGQSIVSLDGHYELVMQSDGNLVEYIVGGRAIWASHTNGDTGSHAEMQPGGNLAVYNPAGAAVYSSNSRGTGCPQLVIQDDGNLVIYSPRAIWSSRTVQTLMEPGDVLHPGWSIYSPSEQLQLIMQDDGNLVLYDGAGKALWASGTDHHPGAYATMQTDGNFVVYPPSGHALWASDTDHHAGAFLSLQSDGNLVVYQGSTPLWASKTNGKQAGGSLGPKPPAAVTSCPAPAPPPPPQPVVTTPVATTVHHPPAPGQDRQLPGTLADLRPVSRQGLSTQARHQRQRRAQRAAAPAQPARQALPRRRPRPDHPEGPRLSARAGAGADPQRPAARDHPARGLTHTVLR